jgi:hypothetical protein
VLLDPEGDEQLRDPPPDRRQAVKAGVGVPSGSGADGDQAGGVVHPRFAVMDVEPIPSSAGAAETAVAL